MTNEEIPGGGRCALCGKPIPPGRLMCPPHWRLVPARLRSRVNIAYADWHLGAITLGELRAAQEAAVDAVRTGP